MSSDLMLMLWDSFVETVIMVGLSGFIGSVFGIPLGILLHVTDNGGVHPSSGNKGCKCLFGIS